MNFSQWQKYAAKKEVSKITYICGDEFTLVELVLDSIKSILDVPVTDYTVMNADQDLNLWEIASQFPLDITCNRLTVIRDADKISDWSGLDPWISNSRNNPKNFLVFVSEQSDAPSTFSKGKRTGYQDHIELIRNKGKFIRCSKPNDEDLISWCESYGLTRDTSEFLIDKTSADLAEIYSVLRKIHIWNGPPSKKAIDLFCQELALDSLADYLILMDKKSALLSLKSLDTQDYAKVLSKLDYRLDYMIYINRCIERRMYDADIAQTTGIKIYLVKKFKSVAKEYNFNKVKMRRQLITLVDSHIRVGATIATMESLIVLW